MDHVWKLFVARMREDSESVFFLDSFLMRKLWGTLFSPKQEWIRDVLCQKSYNYLLSRISNGLAADISGWSSFNFVERKESETLRPWGVFVAQSLVIHFPTSGKYTKRTTSQPLRGLPVIPATHLLRGPLFKLEQLGKIKILVILIQLCQYIIFAF